MTLREALAGAVARLSAEPRLRGNAQQDATVLLLHVLGISRAQLLAGYDDALGEEQLARFEQAVARRLASEPVQYITGEREFYGLPFCVTPAVLIPRNATEHLVEAVVRELDAERSSAPRIVDVGTGSGAIAIALAVHLPDARLTALDISAAALEVAAHNARLNNVGSRVRLLKSDLLSAVRGERFDAVVSNPPYISTAERATLHPEVSDFEPSLALYAGAAGMDIYRRLVPEAHAALKPHGLLALEIGLNQQAAISALLGDWADVRFVEDLQRIPRVALARRR